MLDKTNARSPRGRLRMKEKYELIEYLKPFLLPQGAGICEYQPGWTDHRVAQALATEIPDITASIVGATRREIFGTLKVIQPRKPRQGAEPGAGTVGDRLTRIEARLGDLSVALERIVGVLRENGEAI